MELQIARWGNSLALRLPSEVVKALHLQDGAKVDLALNGTSQAVLSPVKPKFDKAAYMRDVRALTMSMPMTESVVRQMRDDARY